MRRTPGHSTPVHGSKSGPPSGIPAAPREPGRSQSTPPTPGRSRSAPTRSVGSGSARQVGAGVQGAALPPAGRTPLPTAERPNRLLQRLLALLRPGERTAREVRKVLADVERHRTVVRIEFEHSQIRFNTRLVLKPHAILVGKPPGLGPQHPGMDSFVRLHVPGTPSHELRMQVSAAHYNLANNHAVFLCKVPRAFARPSKRKEERYDTSRYRDLRLELPGHVEPFRVVDLSLHGCRILTAYPQPHDRIPAGREIRTATLLLGRKARVPLVGVIPRSFEGKAVGLRFALEGSGDSHSKLQQVLQSLQASQHRSLQAMAW